MANVARITQDAVELPAVQPGTVRIDQEVIEFAVGAGITCGNPPNGVLGTAYSFTFPFGGGTPPYTFTITAGALPTGLSLGASTGTASGTPTAIGAFTFTITITDSAGTTSSVTCSITITRPVAPIWIQLIGWKLYPETPCSDNIELPELPSVKRAM